MSLYRLFVTSAIALTLSMPAYSSVTNSGRDSGQESRDELVEGLDTHKIKSGDPDKPTFVIPTFKRLTGAEQLEIIAQANSGNESAQDEVANRFYWWDLGKFSSITIQTWENLQEKARSSDVFCHLLLMKNDEARLNHVHPNIITDLLERANQGNAAAQTNLGIAYGAGVGVAKDPVKAFGWLQKAADQEFPTAQLMLSHAYGVGIGVAKDPVKAVELIQKAADQGLVEAQTRLGCAYWEGIGVAKDLVKAVEWVQKAADQGLVEAQSRLGFVYWNGIGVAQDLVKAVEWFQIAADQGLAMAQSNLGFAYLHGIGVAKDSVKAVEWYQKAAQQGDNFAIRELRQVFTLKHDAAKLPGSFKKKVGDLHSSIMEITAHCQQKMLTNKGAHGMREAPFAIECLVQLYTPIFEFGDRLSLLLLELTKTQPGFMVSCINANETLAQACANQTSPTSLLIRGDTITFGARNVNAVLQFEIYLQTMKKEFKKAGRDLDKLMASLFPPIASLYACQQSAITGDENAIERFKQERDEYNEVLGINKPEIERLTQFKNNLDVLEKDLTKLMPSTIGMRNNEFLESKEFGFLKP